MGDRDSGRKENVRRLARCTGAVMVLAVAMAIAQPEPPGHPGLEHHTELPSVEGAVGVVHFANSGAERAQPAFQRGLALLHSFEYAAARREFQQAESLDPSFAMAVWGEALTYNHTLWHEQDTMTARAAMAKLGATPEERIAHGRTARERDYLSSLEKLYGPGDKAERDAAYSAALGELSHRYPNDLDGKSLYALSLLGLSPKRDARTYMRAAAVAEEIYEVDKHHPGALHYLIHAYDDPVHAPLGLRAARLYAQVAPGAAHAQHMTSHIFFSLGLWDEAIKANENSVRVAQAQGEHAYHSLLWLEYAYLQKDERSPAAALVRSLTRDIESGPTKENRLRAAFARATWLVETQGAVGGRGVWGNAAVTGGATGANAVVIADASSNVEAAASADAFRSVDSTGVTYIGYFAVQDFARGLVAAGKGDVTGARGALTQLSDRINSASVAPVGENRNWFDALTENDLAQARVLATALEGAVEFADGKHASGIARVREAIAATAQMEFEYGPPWSAKPLDELLGELLLADGQRTKAVAAFEHALFTYPNRRLSVQGLAAAR
jgi:tetratricopeptide (TPR) repeat protein